MVNNGMCGGAGVRQGAEKQDSWSWAWNRHKQQFVFSYKGPPLQVRGLSLCFIMYHTCIKYFIRVLLTVSLNIFSPLQVKNELWWWRFRTCIYSWHWIVLLWTLSAIDALEQRMAVSRPLLALGLGGYCFHISRSLQWTTCFIPVTRDSGSNPLGGTYVKPGFLLLALSLDTPFHWVVKFFLLIMEIFLLLIVDWNI